MLSVFLCLHDLINLRCSLSVGVGMATSSSSAECTDLFDINSVAKYDYKVSLLSSPPHPFPRLCLLAERLVAEAVALTESHLSALPIAPTVDKQCIIARDSDRVPSPVPDGL